MEAARRMLGLEENGHLVLFFGVLRRYKGLDVLLEAMAYLHRRLPDVKLVVAGAPSRDVDVQGLCDRVQSLGIDKSVVWHVGYVPCDKVHLYFYACDVVALSHRKVYDSGVLKIAQALGRPVVVTDTGGLASAVDGGRAGLVVPSEDPKAMARALQRLIADPAFAMSLAKHGQTLSRTAYSWVSVAEWTEQFYREVLEG
jgi:glycosyltransferase involved in cell wall biosynthesis